MSEPKRKTLAELEQSPHVKPMERTLSVCVAGQLVGEYEALDVEFQAAYSESDSDRPRRASDGPSRADQIAQQMEQLRDQMIEHEVLVRVRRKTPHDWRAYADAHPPRITPGQHTVYCRAADDAAETGCKGCQPNLDDARHAVNLDDLAVDVGDWVVSLNGEPADRDRFDRIVATPASFGDLRDMARSVAAMHEGKSLVPKSRLDWLKNQRSGGDSK